ncbi:S-adenosylmethionine decarboxylase [Thermus phage TMA]|uniref:S-adenosylmethionine decarboxylase n=1 Tax=Thermus phage TMA TaxID=699370 RepID=UPI00021AAE1E|nr:S-adenosylmethionine decarboxylase [Thermus phage TMA]BAK53693.1 S-adenosylmethionine decarboxylase [Thermus phage TMA]
MWRLIFLTKLYNFFVKNKQVPTEGTHVILELRVMEGKDFRGDKLKFFFYDLLKESNATIIDCKHFVFPNEASSGVCLLGESHLSWHYWIDEEYVSLDIYTCGNSFNHIKALSILKENFVIDDIKILKRGINKRGMYKIKISNEI